MAMSNSKAPSTDKRSFGAAGIWPTHRAVVCYRRLNELLDRVAATSSRKARCRKFYHQKLGRRLSVSAGDGGLNGADVCAKILAV